jgi:hypothetical protein
MQKPPAPGSPPVASGAPDLTLHTDRYTLVIMEPKPASAAESGGGEVERYGPLELRRLRKDDGRGLIVYSRVEGSSPGDRAGGEQHGEHEA